MFTRIDHVEILPGDFGRSMAFYQDVLEFRLVSRMPVEAGSLKEIAYLQLGDTVIELLHMENPAPMSSPMSVGYRAIALEVESMEAAIAYLHDHGIAVTWGPIDLGVSIRAEITDPDGLTIELREWKDKPW
ncbi:VOC family protein [Methanosarcina sp. MSH10X1]|uniref:VOC family protein n=1 Tax=Methanosarcina sp. MSH10X1 TaxID=2507075 RepID=UPI000FFB40A0|nr:VOC family protein [Methanosarcina sp. MSH10X1]RXA16790.1 VOC family protein [Methanosarcina sp. MSH10X1]